MPPFLHLLNLCGPAFPEGFALAARCVFTLMFVPSNFSPPLLAISRNFSFPSFGELPAYLRGDPLCLSMQFPYDFFFFPHQCFFFSLSIFVPFAAPIGSAIQPPPLFNAPGIFSLPLAEHSNGHQPHVNFFYFNLLFLSDPSHELHLAATFLLFLFTALSLPDPANSLFFSSPPYCPVHCCFRRIKLESILDRLLTGVLDPDGVWVDPSLHITIPFF